MALIGFLLLLIGGGVLLYTGVSIGLNPLYADFLLNFINSILGPPYGDIIVTILVYFTSLGAIFVIVGAIIWYISGQGIGAIIGKILVMLATFAAFFYLATEIITLVGLGISGWPPLDILFYFLTPPPVGGLGITAVILILVGDFIGAGRKRNDSE